MSPDFIAVLGPTASGKSDFALALARRAATPVEIVCCDSMQVYRGMDIGTGKPTPAERAEVPHHALDLVDPGEPFHAARWAQVAEAAIIAIRGRGAMPIVVGGTGLYFRALTQGLFDAPPPDPSIRARHQEEAAREGIPSLHARLRGVDPEAAARIHATDLVRISRALEVWEQTGRAITELHREAVRPGRWRPFVVILEPAIADLRARIERRVDAMMAAGFLAEVERLRGQGFAGARSLGALGYKELAAHLAGTLPLVEAVAQTKAATVAYARRQRTWFRKERADLTLPAAPDLGSVADRVPLRLA